MKIITIKAAQITQEDFHTLKLLTGNHRMVMKGVNDVNYDTKYSIFVLITEFLLLTIQRLIYILIIKTKIKTF